MINMFHNNVETAMVAAIISFNASSAHIVQRRLKSKIFFNCTAGAASHYMSAIQAIQCKTVEKLFVSCASFCNYCVSKFEKYS